MIITKDQVKSILNMTGNDSIISMLIPEAEAKYLQIRNRPFDQLRADTTAASSTLTNVFLSNGDSFKLSMLNRFDYLTNDDIDSYITELTDSTITVNAPAAESKTDQIFTVYPHTAKYTAAKLIQYLMNKNSMNGLQSENIGSYSWSKNSTGNPAGVPADLYKSIKRYA